MGYKVVNIYISTEVSESEIVNSEDIEEDVKEKELVDKNQFNMTRYVISLLYILFSAILGYMFGSGLIFEIFKWIKERRPLKIRELELKIKLAELQQNSTNNKDDKDNAE